MANEQNLIPFTSDQSREEAKKNGQKGGIASGEARRMKRTLREQMELLLSLPIQDENTKAFITSLGIDPDQIDNGTALVVSMYQESLKGNTKAFELFRDTIGEKPTDKIAIEEAPYIEVKRPEKKPITVRDDG